MKNGEQAPPHFTAEARVSSATSAGRIKNERRDRPRTPALDTPPKAGERRAAQRTLVISDKRESAYKPGSVESSHSSRTRVAAHLERPTRELVWAHSTLPYSVLLRVGFAVPQSVATCAVRSYRTFSPLPAIAGRRYIFCCTFRRLAPPRRYLAPCPAEPGLSSRIAPSDCPADSRA